MNEDQLVGISYKRPTDGLIVQATEFCERFASNGSSLGRFAFDAREEWTVKLRTWDPNPVLFPHPMETYLGDYQLDGSIVALWQSYRDPWPTNLRYEPMHHFAVPLKLSCVENFRGVLSVKRPATCVRPSSTVSHLGGRVFQGAILKRIFRSCMLELYVLTCGMTRRPTWVSVLNKHSLISSPPMTIPLLLLLLTLASSSLCQPHGAHRI